MRFVVTPNKIHNQGVILLTTTTWHHGLIARWWAEFNKGGPEVEYFRALVERSGEPALDLGCGAGRLLIPLVQSGLDVDGCDASEDMIAHARELAGSTGLSPGLFCQAVAELDLQRTYRTIFLCGAFGLGSDRRADLEGLRRMHAHLEPGGVLAFDIHLPNQKGSGWRMWLVGEKPELPAPWPERGDRRRAADGTELELRSRVVDFDPLDQVVVREMRASHWRGEDLLAREESRIRICLYFKSEILLMLESAGFRDVQVMGGLEEREARPWTDGVLMFLARRGSAA